METRVRHEMHPALLQLLIGFFLITTDVFFLVVLLRVGDETPSTRYLCRENSTGTIINENGTCWTWSFGSSKQSCMFSLLFASTVCLDIAVFIFFISSIVKCCFPEFMLVLQRILLFRYLGRYLSVALNFAACIMASALLVYVSVLDDEQPSSCYHTGHLWWNCRKTRGCCYLYALLLTGCIFSLVSTFLTACDARLMYIGRKDLEEQERIYQTYVDYHAIKDMDSY